MRTAWILSTLLAVAAPAAPLVAQDPATVEAIAPLLMAGDRRGFDQALFARSLLHLDAAVRRTTALTVGRIGDRRGTALLITTLKDQDRNVVADAFFALGLIQDSTAVESIISRLRDPDSLSSDAAAEAASALAKIGGATAAGFLGDVIGSGAGLARDRRDAMLANAVLETWRLGGRAPIPALINYATDTSADLRWRAVYALVRLRSVPAASVILRSIRDADALVRETAAKGLTRAFADSAKLPAKTVTGELARAFDDERPGVRINALAAAATWRDSLLSVKVARLLVDRDPNVRVQAATTLGELRGSVAVAALDAALDQRDASWAMRRAALLALSRADTARFAARASNWTASTDFRDRIVALDGWSIVKPSTAAVFRDRLGDADPRVQAAALDGWRAAVPRGDSALLKVAREWLKRPDANLRESALGTMRGNATIDDLDGVIVAWRLGASDSELDARLGALGVLAELAKTSPEVMDRLTDPTRRSFLD